MRLKFLLFFAAILVSNSSFADEARLMRFPNTNGESVAFSYGGDLYTVSINGGVARKITSDVGYEMMPRFSPDGTKIAFTGQYDGNTEVFLIPSEGGEPKRLTYTATLSRDDIGDRMGPNNIVMDWTPDSKYITYRSRSQTFNDFTGQLFNVPVEGGMSVAVPLKNSGFSSWSPDGSKLAYNYIFREFRTWKRYVGGMADDIRIFDTKTKESHRITNNKNQDIVPMWSKDGKTIYYISDRDNVMNIYSYNIDNKSTKQLTNYKDYDVKFPSISNDYIVYEYDGYIYKMNLGNSVSQKIEISINNDKIYSRPQWYDLSNRTTRHTLSSDGESVALVARGDIFIVPVDEGVVRNLTNSSNANDKLVAFSPKDNSVAYVSDKSGEFNIHIYNLDNDKEKQITNIKGFILNMKWTPDGENVVWSDKSNKLNITNVESGKTTMIDKGAQGGLSDFDISPDSRWITYTRPQLSMSDIVIYNIASAKKDVVTDQWYDSYSPKFSRDGKYLLFVSDRTYNPTYSNTEWNHAYTNMSKIYLIPLQNSTKPLFVYNEEELGKGNLSDKLVDIDFDGIMDRTETLPILAGNYSLNSMINNNIYYNRSGKSYLFDIEEGEEKEVGARVMFSSNYKKALIAKGGEYGVSSIPNGKANIKDAINFAGVAKLVDYQLEWAQIYDESWRQMRDYFYDRNMHGVDWDKIRTKYSKFIPYIAHRSDLSYIIGDMIGELNIGHAYSQNGEKPEPNRVKTGLLGAQFKQNKSGAFEVTKVLNGVNWDMKLYSPLKSNGIKEGEYILAIDGVATNSVNDIYKLLQNKANLYVELLVNSQPSKDGARKVNVKTIANESSLYYYTWVQSNIDKVSKATDGKVGYIHIPDMGVEGLNQFMKHYYPQLQKEALIIDDRGNGGGNVSPMITERLKREITMYTMHSNQEKGAVNPVGTFLGPKVLLVNEYSASDGDLFPYRFKTHKLGKVVGRRTWGGVVGYSGSVPVVDGGSIVTPSYAPYSADGKEFIIEGWGVEPDIDIENDAYQEFMGNDQQLNRAIEVVLNELKTKKVEFAPIPKFPNKSGK